MLCDLVITFSGWDIPVQGTGTHAFGVYIVVYIELGRNETFIVCLSCNEGLVPFSLHDTHNLFTEIKKKRSLVCMTEKNFWNCSGDELLKEFKTDSELAAFLGISRSTLSNWNARNSIDFPLLLGSLDDVDYNWLLTGKGSPAHHSKFCDNDLVQGEVEILHTPKTTDPMDDRSVTLYDISAAANLKTLLADRPQYALGRIVIPNIPVCDGAVYVSGDSMYPILKSGDIVGFKSIRDFTDVIYGEMYLVSFERGGDEYLAVKYVNHSERPDCIRLVSYNNHHDPMDLPLAAVNAMAIVKFSIRKNMMM